MISLHKLFALVLEQAFKFCYILYPCIDKHAEFIAADTSDIVVIAEHAAKYLACFFKHFIAVGVTVGIVDALEVIKVKYDKRVALALKRIFKDIARILLEGALIEYACQKVYARHIVKV